MSNFYPLRLRGIDKETIWGGNKINSLFSNQSNGKIGERWVVSAREKEDCIIQNGPFKGMQLTEYLRSYCSELFPFPLLIKFIDAADRLSVQVHPDDPTAAALGDDTVGKTEMWHIIEAEEGATIVYGVKPGVTTDELRTAVEENRVESILNFVPVKAGDTFFIPAGVIHAIGKGILLAEVQQNSDTTYRFYDYGRLDASGKPRELHIEKALKATKIMTDSEIEGSGFSDAKDRGLGLLAHCPYFKVTRLDIKDPTKLMPYEGNFISVVCLSGSGKLIWKDGDENVSSGDGFFIPSEAGEVFFDGCASLLISTCPSKT